MLITLLLFCLSCGAFTISSVAGGGAGLIVMPALGLLLPASRIPAALSIGTMCSTLGRIATFHRAIHWRVVLLFVPPALPAAALGVLCLRLMHPVYLELLLGLFLSGNFVLLLRPASDASARPGSWQYLPFIGLAAGFISGFTGATGLLFNRFYQTLGLHKESIIATRAANEVLLHTIKLVLYAQFGLFDHLVFMAGLCVGVSALAALWVTKLVIPWLTHKQFCRIGHVAAALAGIFMLSSAAAQIVQEDAMSFRLGWQHGKTELIITWRKHSLALELKHPFQLELKHHVTNPPDPETARQAVRLAVVHLTADQDVIHHQT